MTCCHGFKAFIGRIPSVWLCERLEQIHIHLTQTLTHELNKKSMQNSHKCKCRPGKWRELNCWELCRGVHGEKEHQHWFIWTAYWFKIDQVHQWLDVIKTCDHKTTWTPIWSTPRLTLCTIKCYCSCCISESIISLQSLMWTLILAYLFFTNLFMMSIPKNLHMHYYNHASEGIHLRLSPTVSRTLLIAVIKIISGLTWATANQVLTLIAWYPPCSCLVPIFTEASFSDHCHMWYSYEDCNFLLPKHSHLLLWSPEMNTRPIVQLSWH